MAKGNVDITAWSVLLNRLMEATGATNAWLAGQVEVDPKTVGRWRNGRFAPTPDNVRDTARVLGYPPLRALVEVGFLTREEAGFGDQPHEPTSPLPEPLRTVARILSSPRYTQREKDALLRAVSSGFGMWTDVTGRPDMRRSAGGPAVD